jgi:hypothetical protein
MNAALWSIWELRHQTWAGGGGGGECGVLQGGPVCPGGDTDTHLVAVVALWIVADVAHCADVNLVAVEEVDDARHEVGVEAGAAWVAREDAYLQQLGRCGAQDSTAVLK